jgi:hypothetical protein
VWKFKKVEVDQDEHSPGDQQVSAHDPETAKPVSFEPATKKKVRSEKQREASRRNGALSHGPKNTERTRYNAMKHALRSQGLTELDDVEAYEENLRALTARYPNSNPYIKFLIKREARDMARSERIDQLEAQYITALSSPPDKSTDPNSEGGTPTIDPTIMKEYAAPVFGTLQRYATATVNSVIRCQRELDRVTQDKTTLATVDIDVATGNVTI